MKTYEIIKTKTLRELPSAMKKKGLRWLTLKETYDAVKAGYIEDGWYDTATGYIAGEVRILRTKELDNLDSFYEKKGFVVAICSQYDGLFSDWDLDDLGHGVGVKETEDKKCPHCGNKVE